MTDSHTYDYIRIIKPPAIRFFKNISLFVAAALMIGSIILLSGSTKKEKIATPASVPVSQKAKTEKSKNNSFLRRFISYYRVPVLAY